MQNPIFMSALLLFALSSCGQTLEVLDWIDRAKEECRVANTTEQACIAVKCTVTVREGEIKGVYPWDYASEEWYEGECKEAFQCVREFLKGKKVKDRSGDYEHNILIMPARK